MNSRIFTVPNQLTFLRLGFLPFFIISVHYRRYDFALAVLILAALTDGLDGILARSLNQKTALGAYLDPIADKLLLSSSFVVLALNRKISWWLATLVLDGAANSAGVCRGAAGRGGLALAAGFQNGSWIPCSGIYGVLRISLQYRGRSSARRSTRTRKIFLVDRFCTTARPFQCHARGKIDAFG